MAPVAQQVPQQQRILPKKNNPFNNDKFEEDKDDSMQINSNKPYNGDVPLAEVMFNQDRPDLRKNMSQNSQGAQIQADNMDAFLSAHEKERAHTIYQQMQQMREESVCGFCNQFISEDDQMNQNLYMLQTTDCFHQIHVDCFREEIVKCLSDN